MRIFFVTNNYTPYSGGVVSSIDATVNELRTQGHDVKIVTLNFLGTTYNDPDYVIRLTCPIRFMYKKNHMAIPLKPTQELLAFARSYRPDIIHVHHPFLLGISGLHVAQYLHIPCIFTYHTLYEEYVHYIPTPLICTQHIVKNLVTRFCSQVDGIIAPSTYIKNYIRESGIICPIEVIPSPLRTLFLEYKNSENQKKQFFDLLIVSRFTKEKNIPFIFDVFKQLPHNTRLTLVGYGTEYDNMQTLAFNYLCLPHERVHFIHKPEPLHLREIYRSCDIFIFSSQTDTQGLVLAEAMSQGLPVIALNGPGQQDIIKNSENGFIINNAAEAALVIQKIMDNPLLLHHLKNNAYATSQKYCPQTVVDKLCRFYAKMIE